MAYRDYFDDLAGRLSGLAESQGNAIEAAARLVAECIMADGVVHVFGSGHSHMMAEEVFHRAGGLMAVNAMLDPNLTSFGVLDASSLERTEGYARVILSSYGVRPGEVLIVVSNSGINPVPIDMAVEARSQGITVIAVTSAANYADAASRHSSGKKLAEIADLVVDSQVPVGDAIHELDDDGARMGAASTVLGAALMNGIMVEAAEMMLRAAQEPPMVVSMNVPEGDERNAALMQRYAPRLRLLKR